MSARPARGPARVAGTAVALLAVVAVGCGTPAVEVPDAGAVASVREPVPTRTAVAPRGTVTVAYPDDPAALLDLAGDDPAAADLQALWGLPLFRIDPDGQLAPGLVRDWRIAPGSPWTVELELQPGRWTDGSAVTAADVAATVAVLRAEAQRVDELEPLERVDVVDAATVRFVFEAPYARWFALLDGVGVLPAHVLEDQGLAAFRDGAPPVSGGAYRLVDVEPGLRYRFEAQGDGPLGPPGPAVVEVLVVPRFETALGMLEAGDVDVALGHVALNPVERALVVDGVEAAAPLGGTWMGVTWRRDGPLGGADAAPRRRAVGAAFDVAELVEGLLAPFGEVATSPVPGVAAPVGTSGAGGAVGSPTLAVPRWNEAAGFTARALQRDLRAAGGGMDLVSLPTPRFALDTRDRFDGALRLFRTGPRPTLVPWVADAGLGREADAAVPDQPPFADGLEAVREEARLLPLYRVGVAHVWSEELTGLRPSAWPGLALWDVASWSLDAG